MNPGLRGSTQPTSVRRLAGFGLNSNDAAALSAFYQGAFGCTLQSTERCGASVHTLFGVRGGARRLLLTLGDASIEILQFDEPGRPYPPHLSPLDSVFQHFALVVSDMTRAMQRLSGVPGWVAISQDGPQRLPQRSGGVTAFKFRDPDGHPLELLQFARGDSPDGHPSTATPFLGIDHSALSSGDPERSIAFYQGMRFTVGSRSENVGVEQHRLDGIESHRVDVVALLPMVPGPHVELLGYHASQPRRRIAVDGSDIPASRLILERSTRAAGDALEPPRLMEDPDGHRLLCFDADDAMYAAMRQR